jgi:hypothetical protein
MCNSAGCGVPAGAERSMAAISVEAALRSSSELGQGPAHSHLCGWNPEAPSVPRRGTERPAQLQAAALSGAVTLWASHM